jgi:hypothetical protein
VPGEARVTVAMPSWTSRRIKLSVIASPQGFTAV